MATTVAINGFGRVGRAVLRAIHEAARDDVRVVAVNDLAPTPTSAHLLRYDSVHGRFPGEIREGGDFIDVGNGPIRMSAAEAPEDLSWDGVDVALECTGRFTTRDAAARHLSNGAKSVLVSAPCAAADRTVVYGVNHDALAAADRIVSNASCTTNCLAPLAKTLDEAVGIVKGDMTTIHAFTGDQPTLDAPHCDLYRARAASMSMVPTSTGAAKSRLGNR